MLFSKSLLGAIPWAITAEIYPLEMRSLCIGITTSANWIGNLGMSLTFLGLTTLLTEAAVFWLYAGLSCITLVILYFQMPETKGLSLEDAIKVWILFCLFHPVVRAI